MKNKGHFVVSMIKSGLRIAACGVALCHNIPLWAVYLCLGLILAEILGVLEELVSAEEDVFESFGLEPQETEEE